jgi:hypothetical protein
MSFISTDFYFNGIPSTPYNIKLIKMEEDMTNTIITGGKNLQEVYKPSLNYPYFFKSSMKPIELNFQFVVDTANGWDASTKNTIFSWLYSPTTYCDFISYDNLNVVYKVIFISPIELFTYDAIYGYLNLTAMAYPFAYTPVETHFLNGTGTITIDNKQNVQNWDGTYYYYPKIWIDANAVSASVINTSDSNRLFQLSPVQNGEQLYIDNSIKYITSSVGTNRLTSLTSYQWLRLVRGTNILSVTTNCDIVIECQYPILT